MNKRVPFMLGFILLAIALWLQTTTRPSIIHLINRLENLAYDTQLRTKLFTHKKLKDTSIAIVDVDDNSLEIEGRWPWPRAKVATLIDRLQQHGAVVVALDVLFPEKEANIVETVLEKLNSEKISSPTITPLLQKIAPFFDNDAILATSLSRLDVVLGISFLPRSEVNGLLSPAILELKTNPEKQLGFINAPGVIGNIPVLQPAAKHDGFINVFPDEDGIIRRVPILIRYQDKLYPSLALEAVRIYLLSNISLVTARYTDQLRLEGVKLGDHIIPTDEKGQVIVPFRGKSFTFPYYSATDVLNNKIPPKALEGKIIFIGTSATGLGDLKATAIENIFPGVEIQATIADGILTDNFSYKPAWSLGAEIFTTLFLGILLIFIFPYLGPRTLLLLAIVIPVSLIFANNWLWDKTGLLVSILIPMVFSVMLAVINVVYGYLFETLKRERLKEMFGQYVPAKHIDEMLTSSGSYGLYGEDREMTVLFADIRNFTSISEPLSATQLKEMLNEFFTPMTEVIFQHRGTIDKYVGDMIMAFWGAPLKDKRHAQHAVSAALDMQHAVDKLKPQFAAKGWAEVNIGIGLNSGIMSVGDMGSKFRRNYTVLGDAVNLASRVESLTKFYGAKIMVTESTALDQKYFVFRKVDRVQVKGKYIAIEIYEVLCRKKELTLELKQELALYHSAQELYFQQQWENARIIFSELSVSHPNSVLYKLYLDRIEHFLQNPPPSDWNGVYIHLAK
ncbi:MAG: adenylate/guanylate cyclase domain-containing protein [Gammaproteobacteria bacterium]